MVQYSSTPFYEANLAFGTSVRRKDTLAIFEYVGQALFAKGASCGRVRRAHHQASYDDHSPTITLGTPFFAHRFTIHESVTSAKPPGGDLSARPLSVNADRANVTSAQYEYVNGRALGHVLSLEVNRGIGWLLIRVLDVCFQGVSVSLTMALVRGVPY
jgi:hypothetical protein